MPLGPGRRHAIESSTTWLASIKLHSAHKRYKGSRWVCRTWAKHPLRLLPFFQPITMAFYANVFVATTLAIAQVTYASTPPHCVSLPFSSDLLEAWS